MDDAELVRATRAGDVAAFTAIFDRHAARVHDLALAMLRDRSAALEVVELTFLEASLRLQGLEEEHRLPVWLLAVTRRNGALRAGPTAGADRQPALPNDDPERVHLAGLVWEAVADLPLRDRTLVDLDLRQGLDGHDLADALGVTITQAQGLQARMRDRIEKGLSGYLIARTADGRCPELTKVLKGWDGRFTPRESRRIADHVETCRICTQTRFALPSPFALYAAALPAPFPAAVRSRVIDRVVLPAAPAGMPLGVAAPLVPDQAFSPATAAYQSPMPAPAPPAFPGPSPYADPAPFPGGPAAPVPYPGPGPGPYADPTPSPGPDPAPRPATDPTPHPDPATVPGPSPDPAHPEPTPSYPEPAPSSPDPAPAYPAPAPSYPDPAPSYPVPAPAYPDPAPAYPAPAPSHPGPAPAYPDPAPAYPDPAPAYPDPAPDPAHPAPAPVPPGPAPAPGQADPVLAPAHPEPAPGPLTWEATPTPASSEASPAYDPPPWAVDDDRAPAHPGTLPAPDEDEPPARASSTWPAPGAPADPEPSPAPDNGSAPPPPPLRPSERP